MEKLKCKVCGGALVMDDLADILVCESCGTKYKQETIKKMLLELTGPVKIDGPVRVDGIANINALLTHAQQNIVNGDLDAGRELYEKVIDEVDPTCAEAWWGLVGYGFYLSFHILYPGPGIEDTESPLNEEDAWEYINDKYGYVQKYASPEQLTDYQRRFDEMRQTLTGDEREYLDKARVLQKELITNTHKQIEVTQKMLELCRRAKKRNLSALPKIIMLVYTILFIAFFIFSVSDKFLAGKSEDFQNVFLICLVAAFAFLVIGWIMALIRSALTRSKHHFSDTKRYLKLLNENHLQPSPDMLSTLSSEEERLDNEIFRLQRVIADSTRRLHILKQPE